MNKLKKETFIIRKMILCVNITSKKSTADDRDNLINRIKNVKTSFPKSSMKQITKTVLNSSLHIVHINPPTMKIDDVLYLENLLSQSDHKLVIFNIDNGISIFPNPIIEPALGLARINGWLRILSSLPRAKRNKSGVLVDDYLLSIDAATKKLKKLKGIDNKRGGEA